MFEVAINIAIRLSNTKSNSDWGVDELRTYDAGNLGDAFTISSDNITVGSGSYVYKQGKIVGIYLTYTAKTTGQLLQLGTLKTDFVPRKENYGTGCGSWNNGVVSVKGTRITNLGAVFMYDSKANTNYTFYHIFNA